MGNTSMKEQLNIVWGFEADCNDREDDNMEGAKQGVSDYTLIR